MIDGSIEICLHRRLYNAMFPLNEPGDDGRGLVITRQHPVLLSPPQSQADEIATAEQCRSRDADCS